MARVVLSGVRIEAARLRRAPDWAAALAAGLAAGAAMAFGATVAAWAGGLGADHPWRLAASLLLGREALDPGLPAGAWASSALLTHGLLSIAYAATLADLVYAVRYRLGLALGVLFGAALYGLNLHVFTELFPWFAPERGWAAAALHLLFGLTAAWSYKRFERSRMRPAGRVRV